MDQCPGARDLRPGGSAVACRLTLPAGGCAGRRAAAACCGERAECRAGRGWPPGLPGRAGASLPFVLSGGSVLRDPQLAARSCRGGQDLTGPPRGPGEDDPGGGRPAWQPSEAGGPAGGTLTGAAARSGVPRPSGRCGVIGAPAGIPGGPLPDLRRGMMGLVAAARLVPDRWAGVVAGHVFAGHRVVLDVSFGTGRRGWGSWPGTGCCCGPAARPCSDGIAGLGQAAGPAAGLSRLAAVRLADLADTDHCARIALRWEALAADGKVFPALEAGVMLTPGRGTGHAAGRGRDLPPAARLGGRRA